MDLLVPDAAVFDFACVHVENRVSALVIKNSQLFLRFFCHCPRIASSEGSVDRVCNEAWILCAELDVRTAEEGPEGSDLLCCFPDLRGDF